jgi:hypothetical protein
LVLFRGQGLHRQRVDLFAHAVAEGGVDDLVALDAALARKAGDTMTALKCWPSPSTSRWVVSMPALR